MKSEFPSEINPNEPGHEVNEQTPEQFQQFNQPQDILMTEEIDQDRSQPVEINIAALSDLTGQIESLKIQLEERSTQYMRIAADFENYRKRTSKEKEEIDLQVKRNTITELLPVVDNFERARSHLKPQSEGEMTIHKSYQGVYKQLVDCLKRLGVAPMRPEGQQFDPNLHEAVMREATDEHPEGTVLEELVRGYYFGDRVLRHAMVKVAAPKEDVSSSPEDSV
ncbi:nucleotide exchange factor GrpE [Dolichospermum planctonicum UHCC 0167]|jgi:molecular chaperone GrpE|uniref:nucleotide exchange factor GrpE n=1 Tax=Dolichospermum planctonicum TaxID=136072 RepID=UPI0014433BD5|nr:nucleotide exchange factor GrpE [Dolichospermum planctonicum]MCW9679447.1 nucleotide exchange factor GrpE [Dolichospermum planctonicum UHCC 0167]